MYRFDGFNIELTRGDSLQFRVSIGGRDLPEGTQALFTVKESPRDGESVIEKTLPIDKDGVVLIGLAGNDSDIPARVYYWDLRVLIPNGDGTYEVQTPMEYSSFTVLEAIGNAPDGAAWIPVSPIVTLDMNADGVVITVRDKEGTKIATVRNGSDGYTPVKWVDYFDGKDGYTPVKGKDYYTEADKAEMVSAVLSALPVYSGEVADV